MVDHTFLFTGAVKKIRQLIDEERWVSSTTTTRRASTWDCSNTTSTSSGTWRRTILSIMDHLIDGQAGVRGRHRPEAPERSRGRRLYHHLLRDNMIAHINVNWLSPVKVRTTLIGGEKKMVVWNDLEADEKIKVYDKGVEYHERAGRLRPAGQLSFGRHVGAQGRADRGAGGGSQYFVECINNGRSAVQRWRGRPAGGEDCWRRPTQSLKERGRPVEL